MKKISVFLILLYGCTDSGVSMSPSEGAFGNLSRIYLERRGPPGGAAVDSCAEFEVSLRGSYGDFATYSDPVDFRLYKSVNSAAADTSYNLFENFSDCQSNSSPIAAGNPLTIGSGTSQKIVFFRVGLNAGDVYTFKVDDLSLSTLSVDPANISFTSKNGTDRYVAFRGPSQIVSGACYSGEIFRSLYSGASDTSGTLSVIPNVPSGVTLYSDASCSTYLSSPINITSGTSAVQIYYKLSVAIPNSGTLSFSATPGPIDTVSQVLYYDKSGDTGISQIKIGGLPPSVPNSSFYGFHVTLLNSNGTPVPTTAAVSITFEVTSATPANLCYYPTCSVASYNMSIPAGQIGNSHNFQPTTTGDVTFTARITGTAIFDTRTVTVSP